MHATSGTHALVDGAPAAAPPAFFLIHSVDLWQRVLTRLSENELFQGVDKPGRAQHVQQFCRQELQSVGDG
jgi:hypothetical protein